jgi:hypothetical protein
MDRSGRALAVLGLLALAGCAPEVSPGVAESRVRAAEVARQGGDVVIARYQEAGRAGALGSVRGRVYEERRKPNTPDVPLAGTTLMLLPRSETFLSTLETIKQHARDSLERYRDSAVAVQRAREAYETALLQKGGGDLSQGLTVDADGTFALSALPAGDWVLVAAHTVFGKKTAGTTTRTRARAAADHFLPQSKLVSYSYVMLWLRELTVTAGAAATVALTDRNAWLTGVIEDTETPVFRTAPPQAAPTTPGGTPGTPGTGTTGTGSGSPTLSPQR